MKRNSKILIAFMSALIFLSACKKENDTAGTGKKIVNQVSNENNSNETGKEKSNSESNENNLKQVDGARIGSLSSYVEDREVWNEFIDDEFLLSAKKYEKGIHLPRILLDSDDARKANNEIDAIVKNMKEVYKANKANMEDGDSGIVASFSVYQNKNILSIMIENYDIYNCYNTNHHVFNFSLPDGKFIDDDKLFKDFDVEKDDILTLVENGLIKKADLNTKLYCKDITDLSYINNLNNLVGLMLNDLWDNYNSKSRQLFIDEVGRPNFIFDSYESANIDEGPFVLRLESDRFEKSLYSDQYLRMARGLGLNPYDEKNKAFVIYLGGANDEQNLKASLSKLQTWSNIFANFEDPNMIVAVKQTEGGDKPFLIGEECYLIIPKYKNASVSLKELEIRQDGKLQEVGNPYLDYNSCSGPTLICQNISDIGPNGKITIRYRDDVIEFSPQLSLKDGSLILPDGVIDGGKIIDWDKEVEDNFYSYIIFERIKYLIGVG